MSTREFSLLGFAAHLTAAGAEMVHSENEALERGAEIVQHEAQQSVGHYQPASGPFAAWPQLAASTKADRVRQGFPENEPELRTGQLRDSIERTVLRWSKEAEVGSNEEVMVWQELGTSRMPARSILGGAAARRADEVAHEIGHIVMRRW